MAETEFIKAAAFGGYDKTDVDKRLDSLYSLAYEMKNELRETKLLLEKYQEDSEEEEIFKSVLELERAQITQLQVRNENLSEKIKFFREEARIKDDENISLHEIIKKLQNELSDSKLKIITLESQNITEIQGLAFTEVQKSKDLILNTAKKEAQKTEDNSNRFAEDFIIDANNKASKLIYEAERRAAEIIADARNNAEQIRVSSNNLKVSMLDDINKISGEVSKIKSFVNAFSQNSMEMISESELFLQSVEYELKSDGVPIFETPEVFEPEYPEKPIYQQIKPVNAEEPIKQPENKKKNSELDRLQAMAAAIDGGKIEKKSSINLDDLAKQAAALTESDNKAKASDKSAKLSENQSVKKSSGINLADLMKQAAALEGENK